MAQCSLLRSVVIFAILIAAFGVYGDDGDVLKDHPHCRTGQNIYLFADRENCNTYYSCSGADAYRLSCPGDLEFNAATKGCDYKELAGCSIIQNYEDCRGGGSDRFFVPNHFDCQGYIMCVSGTAYKMYCPQGQEYNAQAQACLYPEEARCSYIPKYPNCQGGREYFEPHPKDCSSYYFCQANRDATRARCADGYLFNGAKQLCDFPENVPCKNVVTF